MAYHKVIFSRAGHGTTAGLVLSTDRHDVTDMVAVSRLFPMYEAKKMGTFHVSPAYPTWEQAFGHVFALTATGDVAR